MIVECNNALGTSTATNTSILTSVQGCTFSFWATVTAACAAPPSLTSGEGTAVAFLLASPTAGRYVLAVVQSYGLRMSLGGVDSVAVAHSWCNSAADYVLLNEHHLYSMSINFTNGVVYFYRDGVLFSSTENPIWSQPPTLGVKLSTSRFAYAGFSGSEFNGITEDYRLYRRVLSLQEHQELYFSRGGDNILEDLSLRYTFTGRRINNTTGNFVFRNIGGVYTGGTGTWNNAIPWVGGTTVHRPPRRR
jgi:hypothetical protein